MAIANLWSAAESWITGSTTHVPVGGLPAIVHTERYLEIAAIVESDMQRSAVWVQTEVDVVNKHISFVWCSRMNPRGRAPDAARAFGIKESPIAVIVAVHEMQIAVDVLYCRIVKGVAELGSGRILVRSGDDLFFRTTARPVWQGRVTFGVVEPVVVGHAPLVREDVNGVRVIYKHGGVDASCRQHAVLHPSRCSFLV